MKDSSELSLELKLSSIVCFAPHLCTCPQTLSPKVLSLLDFVEDGSRGAVGVTARANFDCPPSAAAALNLFASTAKCRSSMLDAGRKKFSGIWPAHSPPPANCSCLNFASGLVLRVRLTYNLTNLIKAHRRHIHLKMRRSVCLPNRIWFFDPLEISTSFQKTLNPHISCNFRFVICKLGWEALCAAIWSIEYHHQSQIILIS